MSNNASQLKDKQVINFLVENRYRFWRHFAFLSGFLILIYNTSFPHRFSGIYEYYSLFSIYILFIIMFYVNIYVLVPLFFFRARYLLYVVLVILLVVTGLSVLGNLIAIFEPYRVGDLSGLQYSKGPYEGVIISFPFILITTTIKLLQKWTKDNERISELRNLTLTMELNELRNQINPHFLFNMLNNVKALIRSNPEKASAVIIKLSEFLRYQLYENNDEKTFLTSEINFLSNFINLEKIRHEDLSVAIQSKTDKRTLNNIFVPPNLFTTFVENAVKHSVDISGKESYINISIEVENKKLYFVCRNSKNPDYPVSGQNHSGLGLANIKRRLELLYHDTYCLEVTSTEKEYTINLTIPV